MKARNIFADWPRGRSTSRPFANYSAHSNLVKIGRNLQRLGYLTETIFGTMSPLAFAVLCEKESKNALEVHSDLLYHWRQQDMFDEFLARYRDRQSRFYLMGYSQRIVPLEPVSVMKPLAVIAGSYAQYVNYRREQGHTEHYARYIRSDRDLQGLEFSDAVMIGDAAQRRDCRALYALARTRVR